jgi:hypothetical protein
MKIKFFLILFAAAFSFAGEKQSGFWDFIAKIGLNLGGSMPIPIPANIDKVESYNPSFTPTVEVEAIRWLSGKVGVSAGLRSDNKGMKTTATVKEYAMNFGESGSGLGKFRGTVDTKMSFNYLGLPVLAHYALMESFSVYAGAYYAYLLSGEFKGTAYEGSLNTGSGKIQISSPENYDFSKELRNYDVGLSLGLNYLPYNKHILLSFDFNYGLLSIFPDDFNGIDDKMRNVFGKLSVGYVF